MRYLTTGEVAKRCQVSVGTVKNWIDTGALTAFRTPGGHFRIESGVLDQFRRTFGFPADRNDAEVESAPTPRILVVDDHADSVELLVESVRHILPAASISTATDGYQALLRVGTFHPHVLLLDLRMPGLDGFVVCRRIKEAPETADTKILAITGYDAPSGREKAFRCGADGFIRKPVAFPDLNRELKRLVAASGTQRTPKMVTPGRR